MRDLTISVAPRRDSVSWQPRTVTWEDIVRQLGAVKRTRETVAEYRAMSKPEKAAAKDIGGFVGGSVTGRRIASAVAFRSLVAIDLDYASAGTVDAVRELMDGNAWCLYSTHSHTPESPRLRLVAPLDRDVSVEEYGPIARRIADYVGIEAVDPVSFTPHQLMYWPSCPKDGEFVFEHGDGEPLKADGLLGSYRDWRSFEEWPRTPKETTVRPGAGKQEDPTQKGGVVGAFCRCYSISQAIEEFLPDVYEPTAQPDRWTYKEGTSAGGLVVYDDKWAYSHHATDPIGGREVNAFDLVRIHRFGSQDAEALEDTPVTRLPSWLAMVELCRSTPRVKVDLIEHGARQSAEEAFGAELPETREDNAWKAGLHLGKRDVVLCDMNNVQLILTHDPALKGIVKYDEFADRTIITRDLPWRRMAPGLDTWTDTDYSGLQWYLSSNKEWNMSGKQVIIDAFGLVASSTAYHPVRDYLTGLSWDGVERLDSMVIDYLGALDTPLTRVTTRKHMVAAVARIMHPGVKYEYALTLSGPEGIGKSTLIKKLGMNWYNNSFSSSDVGSKDSKEQIRSCWLIELGELVSVKKNTNEAFKAFLTTDTDHYRKAYGRVAGYYPRQCVFWATTNERFYLKGDTGNRRFWTIFVGETGVKKDVFAMTQEDVDQLWAEAVYRYQAGEDLYLSRELEAESRKQADDANEISGDERIGVIEAFIRRPVPVGWAGLSRKERADWFRGDPIMRTRFDLQGGEERRRFICAQEIANECFFKDLPRYEAKEINQMLRRIDGLEEVGSYRIADSAYGGQRRFKILPEFWARATREESLEAEECKVADECNYASNENSIVAPKVAKILN